MGYVLFFKHTLVRTRTKQRMKKRLKEAYEIYLQGKIDDAGLDQKLQSYLGILSHANQHTLSQAVKNAYWVRTPHRQVKNQKTRPFTKDQVTKNL